MAATLSVNNLAKTAYNFADAHAGLSGQDDFKEWKRLKAEFKSGLQSANWSTETAIVEGLSDKVSKKVEKFSDLTSDRVITAEERTSMGALARSLGESYEKMRSIGVRLGTRGGSSELGLPVRDMRYFSDAGENLFKPEIKKPLIREVKKLAGELEAAPHREKQLAERITALRAPLASLPADSIENVLSKIESRVYNFWAKSFAIGTKEAADRETQLTTKLGQMSEELTTLPEIDKLSILDRFATSVRTIWASA